MERQKLTKNDVQANILAAYLDLKAARKEIISRHMAAVEDDLGPLKDEFARLIQGYRDGDFEFNLTVSDIAQAMMTTNRNTVYEYLNREV